MSDRPPLGLVESRRGGAPRRPSGTGACQAGACQAGEPPPRRGRAWLLGACLAPLLLLAPAQAQPQEAAAQVERRGAWVTYTFPLGRGEATEASLSRGSATLPLLIEEAPGGFQGRLRTSRYLPPGAYQLQVGAASRSVRVGSAAEGQAATKRLEGWYQGALLTLRELSQTLERRGSFHYALREAGREPHLSVFRGSFLSESWRPALLGARMDLATFQRRVLLPPRPQALAALLTLAEALEERARAWEACLLHEGELPPRPGPAAALEGAAQALGGALQRAVKLPLWRAGPLGTPAAPAQAGQLQRDPVGFSLQVPREAKVLDLSDPVDRLMINVESARLVVRVLEFPGTSDAAALRVRLRRDAFERWTSYKLSSSQDEPGGLRLEFGATVSKSGQGGARVRARVIQWARFPKEGERAYLLIALWPEGEALPAALQGLFNPQSFAVEGLE